MNNKEIFGALCQVISLLKNAHQVIPQKCIFEIYHHYGSRQYEKVGAVFVKVVNREYCKSYAILLPGQRYPAHYHKIKQETFFVLYGDLFLTKEEQQFSLHPGEIVDVERLEEHSFYSEKGCVFEEISTTYMRNDSIYTDEKVYDNYDNRKTIVTIERWKEIYRSESGEEFLCW